MNSIFRKIVVANAHVISSEGCSGLPDGFHFTAEGYRKIRKRYGDKMLSLLEAQKSLKKQ